MNERREGKREGFAVEFVRKPPKELQTECSVCLQVLAQPKMVDCCGYRFCSSCLSEVELSVGRQQLCPLCGQPFTSMPDKQLERTLSGFEVYCSHKQKGCKWKGKLGSLLEHLNERPRSEQDLRQGCPFQAVKCIRCRSPCQRSLMGDHVENKCSRRDLDCHFKYAGCKVRKPKPELERHMREAVPTHLSLAISHIHNLITQQEAKAQVVTRELTSERTRQIQAVNTELEDLRRSVSKATSNYGGYDYKFVKKVRNEFICSICRLVFRDPHLTGCCGQRFCVSCLEHSFSAFNKKRCPHCRAEGEEFCHQRDLDMKRKISSLDAHCPQWKDGCKWVGQVKSIGDHVNKICDCVYMTCILGCGSRFMKKDRTKHESEECPDRKVTCGHCGEARGTYRWMTEEHHKVCEKVVVVCSQGCGQTLSQNHEEVERHQEVCTHQPVSCPFEKVGCKEKPIRSKVDEHQTNAIQQHLLLTMLSLQSEREKNELERKRNQVMVDKMRAVSNHIDSLVPLCPPQHRQPLQEIRSILSEQLFALVSESDEVSLLVDSYSKYTSEEWISPPFYVHLHPKEGYGYKMCIGVLASGDVSLYLLKGEYDHLLTWPIHSPLISDGWKGIQVTLINLKLKREMERSRTSNAGRLLRLHCFSSGCIIGCKRIGEYDGPRCLIEKIHICDNLDSSSVDDTIELSLCYRFA